VLRTEPPRAWAAVPIQPEPELTAPQPYFQNELETGCIYPRRVSQPAEVAGGCLFLIENSMMNDHHLRVDGGWRGTTLWSETHDPRAKAISLE
jgi:NAD(P)-dependent dehydrogenase (short-subunit alcohol dehydrogenase family)